MTDPIPTTDQWPIGVALILGASFIGGLGDNLIRYSHRKNNTKTPNYFMFIWMVGMFCTIVLNTMCTVAAFAYADSSLILPFAGTHVIFAVVLAIVINNEKVTMKSWLVLSIILFGILTTVIAGNKETINYSLELMMLLFAKPLFLVVASLILIICLLAFLAFNARWLTPGFQAMSISVVAGKIQKHSFSFFLFCFFSSFFLFCFLSSFFLFCLCFLLFFFSLTTHTIDVFFFFFFFLSLFYYYGRNIWFVWFNFCQNSGGNYQGG